MDLEKKQKIDKVGWWFVQCLIVLYGASMCFLFYKQTQWVDGSIYESDLPAHIKMVIEDGWYYSLTALVYRLLYYLPYGNVAIALFLAVCGVVSVYLTDALLRRVNALEELQLAILGKVKKKLTAHLVVEETLVCRTVYGIISLALNVVMPCYVKGIADGRYIGMEAASIWHNSTYIVMKATALLCMLCYIRLAEEYAQKLKLKDWCIFAGVLGICTAVKPSFFMVFTPMMVVFLCADLYQGVALKNILLFGSTVIPSLAVILLQNMILFGKESGNGWEIRPGYALSLHSGHPMLAALLSILFPLIVLLAHICECMKERWYGASWLMAFWGFVQVFLFCETGKRASDGNFMWGYSFTILMIFGSSILKWLQDVWKIVNLWSRETILRKGYVIVAGFTLVWHIYCGLYFYIHLVQGVSYWMWG